MDCTAHLQRAEALIRLPEGHLHILDVLRLVELVRDRAQAPVRHDSLSARPPRLTIQDLAVPGQVGLTPAFHASVLAERASEAHVVAVGAGGDSRESPRLDEAVDARRAGVEASGPLVATAWASEEVGGARAGAAVAAVVACG